MLMKKLKPPAMKKIRRSDHSAAASSELAENLFCMMILSVPENSGGAAASRMGNSERHRQACREAPPC
jgi:hypothetical protein